MVQSDRRTRHINCKQCSKAMDISLHKGSKIARMIWIVGSPVVFTVGVVGNIMTILVLIHKSQKKSSTTVFLTVLAVVDLLVMTVSLPRWWLIYVFGLDIRHLSNGACKIQWFISYVNSSVSTSILSAVTIERMLSTVMPHKTKTLCSVKIAMVTSGIIILAYMFYYLPIPINFSLYDIERMQPVGNNSSDDINKLSNTTLSVLDNFTNCTRQNTNCTLLPMNHTAEEWKANMTSQAVTLVNKMCWFRDENFKGFYTGPFQILNIISYSVIPEIIFFIGGVVIVRKLRASKTRIAPIRIGVQQKKSGAENYQRQITISLLLVNVVFVVFTTPMVVFITGRSAWVDSEKGMTETQEIVWAVINILFFINHAVNFVLYFLSGARFRKQVIKMFSTFCKKQGVGQDVSHGHVTAETCNTG